MRARADVTAPSGLSSRAVDANGYRSDLARELGADARDRLVRYAQVWTTSDPDSPSAPSTERQLDLSRMLLDELKGLGLDAELSDAGIVYGTLPANTDAPTIGLVAHVDTSPDVSGENVKPQVFRYEGGPHALPGDRSQVLDPDEWPELANHVGHELISSDGTTLLGADDKAGVAEIMAAVAYFVRNPDVPHGTAQGSRSPPTRRSAAASTTSTSKGSAPRSRTRSTAARQGRSRTRRSPRSRRAFTFAAARCTRLREGHPRERDPPRGGLRRGAAARASRPSAPRSATGFIHPTRITGDAENVEVRMILRDFDEEHARESRPDRARDRRAVGGAEVEIRRQYRNMKETSTPVPHAVELATRRSVARGWSRVARSSAAERTGHGSSEFGLPTPNIFTGGQQYHSQREWVCVADMGAAAETIVHLAQLWAERAEAPEGASASNSASASN